MDDKLLNDIKELEYVNKKIVKFLKKRLDILEKNKSINPLSIDEKTLKKINKNKNTNLLLEKMISKIFSLTQDNINQEKIVYLGPQGSYTQEATINKFGKNNTYYSVNSIKNIFLEINENRAKYGIVPIENSSNGIVGDTINCFNNYDLNIIGETVLDIHHTLVSNCTKVEDIKIIYSKDIAFDQCSIFLENYHLNEVKYEYVDSTTKAAKLASQTPNSAAICSSLAASTNNIPILFDCIEDNKDNKTRFLVISKEDTQKSTNDKTSIMVQLPNKYGSLIDFLNDFKEAKINLNKIKSHIVKGISTFFIEFEGHKNDSNIRKILNKHKKHIKILGSYKKEVEDI
ncbi:MAG: prephenate dehydratase domain-containing protein [Aliarcobacter sp.]|nr:prephenate dehydratase domain-containing protein [Aliarcobacter sp.]